MDAGFQDRCNRPLCHLSGAMRAASYSAETRLASCREVFSVELFMLFDSWQTRGFALRATPIGCSLEQVVADQDRMGIPLTPVSITKLSHVVPKVMLHRTQFQDLLSELGVAEMFELQAIGEPLMMPAWSIDGIPQ